MGEDVKLEVIRSTQDSLSKYIKKPPLTEKLLRKPPFRYLHDITTAIMRETGYLQGLYSQDELNPINIKDKDAKIAFLEKLIAAVNISTGVNITARPNKIVAGLDVAKTNELLQTIAKAVEKKVDSSKAVEEVLKKNSRENIEKNSMKTEISKRRISKNSNNAGAKVSESGKNMDSLKKTSKVKATNIEKVESKKELRTKQKQKDSLLQRVSKQHGVEILPSEIHQDEFGKENEKPADILDTTEKENDPTMQIIYDNKKSRQHFNLDKSPSRTPVYLDYFSSSEYPKENENVSKVQNKENKTKETSGFNHIQDCDTEDKIVSQHKNEDLIKTGEEQNKQEDELKRPLSTRAANRKKAHKNENIDQKEDFVSSDKPTLENSEMKDKKPLKTVDIKSEPQRRDMGKRPRTAARPASARPGAPRVRDKGAVLFTDTADKVSNEPVNLIVESKDISKHDDEALVTVEESADVITFASDNETNDNNLIDGGHEGHLVSQILETQKELADIPLLESAQKVDISWSGRKPELESTIKDVDKLRSAIQSLTRTVNPLGKLIDFLQEDVESMQIEFELWRATNQKLSLQLHSEERLMEEITEPLARQLEDICQLIDEQLEESSVVKAAIMRNDERLIKVLKTNVNHS